MEYLILSSLFFAFNNVLWKWIVADYLPLQVIVKRSMITSFIGIIVLVLYASNFTIYTTLSEALFVNLTCTIGALGLIFMIYALKESTLNNFIHYILVGSETPSILIPLWITVAVKIIIDKLETFLILPFSINL